MAIARYTYTCPLHPDESETRSDNAAGSGAYSSFSRPFRFKVPRRIGLCITTDNAHYDIVKLSYVLHTTLSGLISLITPYCFIKTFRFRRHSFLCWNAPVTFSDFQIEMHAHNEITSLFKIINANAFVRIPFLLGNSVKQSGNRLLVASGPRKLNYVIILQINRYRNVQIPCWLTLPA